MSRCPFDAINQLLRRNNIFVKTIDQQSFRDHLYNDILRGGSFDSVSTTSDILNELQQIEDAAQLMYQAMVKEGENDNSNTGMINMNNV